VPRRIVVINLDGVAKLQRGLLKLFLFKVSFPLIDVVNFGFFGISATSERKNAD
jgi:hypothetical protein